MEHFINLYQKRNDKHHLTAVEMLEWC